MKTVAPTLMNETELFNDLLIDLTSALSLSDDDSVFGLDGYIEEEHDGLKIGDVLTNKTGEEFEIIGFTSDCEVDVKFLTTGTERVATVKQVLTGTVKDFMIPSVRGVGYIGSDECSSSINPREYNIWNSMLERCYSEAFQKIAPSYIGCTVHPDWLNFTTFCEEIQSIPGYDLWISQEKFELDKDTLVEGNKEYGLLTCQFIHESDNIRDAVNRRWNK